MVPMQQLLQALELACEEEAAKEKLLTALMASNTQKPLTDLEEEAAGGGQAKNLQLKLVPHPQRLCSNKILCMVTDLPTPPLQQPSPM